MDSEEVGCDAIASVDDIRPHRLRHDFGTSITRKCVDPLYGKELMSIESDKVYCRYTQEGLKQAAESRLQVSDLRS